MGNLLYMKRSVQNEGYFYRFLRKFYSSYYGYQYLLKGVKEYG